MNHAPAPEIRSKWRVVRWLQWIRRAAHFAAWEYGTCHDGPARRNRSTGAVQFVLWPKGHVAKVGVLYDQIYTYPEDWWHDFDSSWWPKFQPDAPVSPRR